MTAMGEDVLAWLDTAITRREQAASAAPKGPWRFVPSGRGPASPPGYEDQKILGADREVAGPGYEGGGIFGEAAGLHIVLNDPLSVLRRCAADRKLLELHARRMHSCPAIDETDYLDEWTQFDHSEVCPVVQHLADGYGWTAGQTPPTEGDQVT